MHFLHFFIIFIYYHVAILIIDLRRILKIRQNFNLIIAPKPHIGYNKWAKSVTVCIELDEELDNTERYSPIDTLIVNWYVKVRTDYNFPAYCLVPSLF